MRTKKLLFPTLVLGILTACVTTTQPEVQRYVPTFDFAPSAQAQPGSAHITFAVIKPRFVSNIALFQSFAEKMGQDFYEVVSARGFGVRGPFATYDQMTYPDKKGSDLLLMPELTVRLDTSRLTWKEQVNGGDFTRALLGDKRTRYKAEGQVILGGRINLVVAESLSTERMWTKSVEIAPIEITLQTTGNYFTMFNRNDTAVGDSEAAMLLNNEPQLYSDVAKALEAQYKIILTAVYNYLDPEEMRMVNKQADEIRKRKVY
jgi:hypothetical protein